jgi:hypothetical protein
MNILGITERAFAGYLFLGYISFIIGVILLIKLLIRVIKYGDTLKWQKDLVISIVCIIVGIVFMSVTI